MKTRMYVLLAGLVVVTLAAVAVYQTQKGPASPLDMVIVDATYDEDMKKVAAVMTDEEARIFSATMFKMVLAHEKVEGLTYRQLLEKGMENERAIEARIQKDLEEFLVRDSLVRDSLRKDSIEKGLIK